MNTKVSDLMARKLVTASPRDTVADARKLMSSERIHAVPIVDGDGLLDGIVSTADLVDVIDGSTPLRRVMSPNVFTIPQYNDISAAARKMRRHRIHHIVVTHERKPVGIVSSFDLLKLIEDHRFVMREQPTPGKKSSRRSDA